ncbi:hypothetical protein [Sphingomonas sp. CV7422]|uniref:hypothetical protein n=1 Tax=Sphingomonas sp. CV7422 TaxID=3018036 RepID=UPI0022FF1830|nr:hypothetical protein [Sphingomonas sp. CV7422]
MTEKEAARRVDEAIAHLRDFAGSIRGSDVVDRNSQLTGDDLRIVLGVFDDVIDKDYGLIKRSTGQAD